MDLVGCQKDTLGVALVPVCHPIRNLIGPRPCSVLCLLTQNQDSTLHLELVLWSVALSVAMLTVPEAGRDHRRTTKHHPVVEAEVKLPDVTGKKTTAGLRVPLPMLQEAQRSVELPLNQVLMLKLMEIKDSYRKVD